jgi:BirA family transcriptional regulator, biotin operon repressor / biotin---[acetyl-CoA-carboxylase] ligase
MHFSDSNLNKPVIIFFDSLESTNDYAKALLEKEKPKDFTIIHTLHQTKGRGQRGNNWISGQGLNLTASWIHYPFNFKIADFFFLNIWVALAVYDALSEILPNHHSIKIKWPNDIYVEDKKIAGILIENTIEKDNIVSSVIGIGLNVNQNEFLSLEKATSLQIILQKSLSIDQLLLNLNASLIAKVNLMKHRKIMKDIYQKHLYQLNETKRYESNSGELNGQIIGVTDNGLLMIESEQSVLKFDLKEIRYL